MNSKLHLLDNTLKNLLVAYLLLLTVAVLVGLVFLKQSTNATVGGTIERWNGSESIKPIEPFDIPENYPKPINEMLLTTHNHLFGFALIFISVGIIFYFNSTIKGFWRSFLIIEPFISAVITFGSIWLMRFVSEYFVYLAIISAVIMYGSFFIMAGICIYELKIKNAE
ncbi:MAG: hypothetical protein KKB34_03155 [Bacteroidetes bacterium]|nr:hypothetical protein [Bacteroidota bacterium]